LIVAVAGAGLARRWGSWYATGLGLLAWLVLNDQHRFQPWAYQYAMTGLFLAAMPGAEGLRLTRWWFVALYAYSGLSKLDASFCDELGPAFLRAAVAPLGLDPARWAAPWRVAAVLAMPVGEIGVAAALAYGRTRGLGRVGAVVLHGALVGILGPLGLGHSAIVLLWNAAMAVEVWVAFGPGLGTGQGPAPGSAGWWRGVAVKAVFWAGVVLPLGERWGVFDAWPSHALYASHVERVVVMVHGSEVEKWPAEIRAHVLQGAGPWRVLDLTGWSRQVRGTPVYSQNRAGLGLAEALTARYGGRLVRAVALGPADRWTGRRNRAEAVGRDAIHALGDRYRLNARPAGTGPAGVSPPEG
jgi:hypothetical protein